MSKSINRIQSKAKWEYKGRFKKKIRIDPKKLEWVQENKDCRTDAGFLDKIINFYKKNAKYIK